MAARLKDIASDLGLSVVTVSKVLRNHPDIGEDTRQRVLARMKQLNYQPNLAARALVTGRTMSVGLVVPDLVHPFFSQLAKGLSLTLQEGGYGLLISSSQEDIEMERMLIDQMLARRVDVLIVASTQAKPEGFRRLEARKTPYILIDRKFEGLSANFVGVDDEAAGDLATEHLITVGCRRIAHIRGPEVSTAVGRLTGYSRALRRHSLASPADYIVTEETGDERGDISGYRAMERLLRLSPKPDGVFCYNDPAAMGAMQAILDAGLRIPQDIAVVGCGNVLYAQFLRVPLSSVDQSCAELGIRAGRLALSLVGIKGAHKPESIVLEPTLVARASTARTQS